MSRWSGMFGGGSFGTFRFPFYRATRSFRIHQSELLSRLHDYTFVPYQSTSWTRLYYHKKSKKGENITSKIFMPHHIPGKPSSGILSRRPGYNKGIDDNDNIAMLPDNLFKIDALFIQEVIMQELTLTSFMPSIVQDRLNLDKSVAQTLEKKDRFYNPMECLCSRTAFTSLPTNVLEERSLLITTTLLFLDTTVTSEQWKRYYATTGDP